MDKPADTLLKNHPLPKKASVSPLYEYLLLACMAGIVFLIYSNTFNTPFVFDDAFNFVNNPAIRLTTLSLKDLGNAGLKSPLSHRPVANISFALNYYMSQYHVFSYHLVNILIHICTGILLFFLLKTTLSLLGCSTFHDSVLIFFSTIIWLVHPLQTQSVTYIVQRMNSMAAMFFIMSLLFYTKGRIAYINSTFRFPHAKSHLLYFVVCILAGFLAMGSKQTACALPFFILIYELYFFQNLHFRISKYHLILFAGTGLVLSLVVFFFLGGHPLEKIQAGYAIRDFSMVERLLTEFRVVIFYISLLFFPHASRLNLDHDFLLSSGMFFPFTTTLSILAIAGLLGTAVYTAPRHRFFSFSILWFFGNLVIESSVIGLEIIFEHRLYLPSMFAVPIIVMFVYRSVKRIWIGNTILCMVIIMCSLWTYERNKVWKNKISLWQDCVTKSPNKARPHYNLGVALKEQQRFEEALHQYSNALDIKPDAKTYYSMGIVLEKLGRHEKAVNHYINALAIRPDPETHYNLGVILSGQGLYNEAVFHFSKTLEMNPSHFKAFNNMGIVYSRMEKFEDAAIHFAEALDLNPNSDRIHFNLGIVFARQGKYNDAIFHLSESMRLRPDPETRRNIELCVRKKDDR